MKELVRALVKTFVNGGEAAGKMLIRLFRIKKTLLVGHVVEKMLDLLLAVLAGLYMHIFADMLAKLLAAKMAARKADDRELLRQKSFHIQTQERRQELALGEVAGDAQNDKNGRACRIHTAIIHQTGAN